MPFLVLSLEPLGTQSDSGAIRDGLVSKLINKWLFSSLLTCFSQIKIFRVLFGDLTGSVRMFLRAAQRGVRCARRRNRQVPVSHSTFSDNDSDFCGEGRTES